MVTANQSLTSSHAAGSALRHKPTRLNGSTAQWLGSPRGGIRLGQAGAYSINADCHWVFLQGKASKAVNMQSTTLIEAS